MRLTTFTILTAVTAVVAVGAIVVQSGTPGTTEIAAGEKLFPALGERLGDVAQIEIAQHDSTITLLRSGNDWSMRERGGYPVNPDAVKKLLAGMVDAERVEAKTSKPDSYPRIQVEDVKTEDAKSILVTLKNAAGGDMAKLIVGKSREGSNRGVTDRLYVRQPDDAQSWLVKTGLTVDKDPVRWLDRRITDINQDRIRRIETVQPDGARLVIAKNEPGEAGKLSLESPVPEGMKVKQAELSTPVSALSGLSLDDVKRASDIDFSKKPAGGAEYRTFDGLVVTVRMSEFDNNVWAIFNASVDEAGSAAPAESATVSEGEQKDAAKPEEEKAEDEKKPALKSFEEVQREAKTLNDRLQGWAYKLPSFAIRAFQSKMADMVEKEESS